MKSIKIGEARDNLSRYLRYVKGGGRVRILDRERPVADLVPVEVSQTGKAATDETRLADLETRGVLRRGRRGAPSAELLRPGPKDKGGRVLAALLEERRSGR